MGFFKPDSKNIKQLQSLEPHYVEVHSYDKGDFNETLAAYLIGAGKNAYWNQGCGGWFCDDWAVDYPEYHRPLGVPLGDGAFNSTTSTWTRFRYEVPASGCTVRHRDVF